MIQSLVGFCLMVGFSTARPLTSKEQLPVPVSSRDGPICAEVILTFCEKVLNYPREEIERAFKSTKFDLRDFLFYESDGLDEPPEYILNDTPKKEEEKNRNTRSIEVPFNETTFTKKCSVASRMVSPEIASNSKGEWRFIAQNESLNIQQSVKVHICADDEECQKSCMQFYTPVSMKSFTDDGKIIEDIFWMPSSCRCSDISENIL